MGTRDPRRGQRKVLGMSGLEYLPARVSQGSSMKVSLALADA